ncbi:hypothetical protein DVT68_11370 [Dyella solisilvae]|uniref:Transporter n=1 Tax=Dyella solisilvae TaxID=1920168 RepID=A0A370K8V9_9GAMM|nr:transporter [Dyella solisilvae]RDI99074.1 hypothetical protein DVT68_11370 [Dyella solisilvae]
MNLLSDPRLIATGASDGQNQASSSNLQLSGWSSGRWSFATIMAVPDVAPAAISGTVPTAWDHQRWDGGDNFDVAVTPLVASYGISPYNHVSLSFGLNVPTNTGRYRRMLARSSTLWTVMPKLAYTQELSSSDRDSSTVVAVGSFSKTAVEGFQGTVGRIEAMVMQRNPSGWSYGGVAAAIQQPDTAETYMATRMYGTDSNSGMSLGVGPQISWSSHWLGSGVDFQYRWIYEFKAPNGHTDQPMLLSATVHL